MVHCYLATKSQKWRYARFFDKVKKSWAFKSPKIATMTPKGNLNEKTTNHFFAVGFTLSGMEKKTFDSQQCFCIIILRYLNVLFKRCASDDPVYSIVLFNMVINWIYVSCPGIVYSVWKEDNMSQCWWNHEKGRGKGKKSLEKKKIGHKYSSQSIVLFW